MKNKIVKRFTTAIIFITPLIFVFTSLKTSISKKTIVEKKEKSVGSNSIKQPEGDQEIRDVSSDYSSLSDKVIETYEQEGLEVALSFLEEVNSEENIRNSARLLLLRYASAFEHASVGEKVLGLELSRAHRIMVVNSLMQYWDPPTQGYEWAENNLEGDLKYDALAMSLQSIAAKSVESAAFLLEKYNGQPILYQRMLTNVLFGVIQIDAETALKFISESVPEKYKVSSYSEISDELVNQDESEAEKVLRDNSDFTLEKLAHDLVVKKFKRNPYEAIDLVTSFDPGPTRDRMARSAIFKWADSDLNDLKSFFSETSVEVQFEIAGAMSAAYSSQSVSEASDWILSIKSDDLRRKMFPELIYEMLKGSEKSAVEWALSLSNSYDKEIAFTFIEKSRSSELGDLNEYNELSAQDRKDGVYFSPNLYHEHGGEIHRH